jgi:hypothetical protein
MDSAKVNDWLQLVGIFALVASLIFVGLQLKQTQEVAVTETTNGYIEQSLNLKGLLIDNADVWKKACAGDELSPEDQIKASQLYRAVAEFNYFTWIGATRGVFQGDGVSQINRFAAHLHRYPGFRKMAESENSWATEGETFDNENVRYFRASVFARLAELESIDSGRDADPSKCGL